MQYTLEQGESPFDFLPTVSTLDSAELVTDYFLEMIAGYGAAYVLMCRVPQPHEVLTECILMDTRPPTWAKRYHAKGYIKTDPLVLTAQRRMTPCTWSEAMLEFSDDPAAQLIHKERLANGVTDGLLVPIHTIKGHGGLVSVATKDALTKEALNAMTFMSLVVHNQLSAMQQSDASELEGFTAREIECLQWSAAGKTDEEIAKILGLSVKTVYYHIDGAKRRINASSRTHAVASAIRIGLFN